MAGGRFRISKTDIGRRSEQRDFLASRRRKSNTGKGGFMRAEGERIGGFGQES